MQRNEPTRPLWYDRGDMSSLEKMKDFTFEICVVSWHPYPERLRMNNAYTIIPD